MKKIYAFILAMVMVISLTACGKETSVSESEVSEVEESTNEVVLEQEVESMSETNRVESDSPNEFEESVFSDVEEVTEMLYEKLEDLSAEIDSFDEYKENIDVIESFYVETIDDTKSLCIKMREHSLLYAEEVMAADTSNDEKYDAMETLYDCIYDDAGDEIYDEIYDGVLDEIYEIFYDGVLDDAYDSVDYKEWSDARSNEYEWWSDTRSDVYEEWSDFRSDVYEFWSDMRSELWSDDIERAEKKMEDFSEDIAKLKGTITSEERVMVERSDVSDTTAEVSTEKLVDGMRPEFKEAMDSYEAFYDEYCDFMKKYSDNPTDLKLLAEYADMLEKVKDMDEKFSEWSDDELNNAEMKYYLDVNNRVMQKMLDVI